MEDRLWDETDKHLDAINEEIDYIKSQMTFTVSDSAVLSYFDNEFADRYVALLNAKSNALHALATLREK